MEEAEEIVNSIFISTNEDLSDIRAAITSPIKYTKLKNNLKQWAKFKLDVAAVEMDAVRKKAAAKDDPEGVDKEKLDTATKAKKQAIKGKMDAIEDRINQLATDDSLRSVARLGKSKASLAANQKLLKIAQAEENDALKLKIEDQIEQDKENITDAENQLKTYAKQNTEDKPEAKPEPSKSSDNKSETPKGDSSKTPSKVNVKTTEPEKDSGKESPKSTETPKDSTPKDSTPKDSGKHTKEQDAEAKKKLYVDEIAKLEKDVADREEGYKITVDNWKEAEAALLKAKDAGNEEEIKKAQDAYSELSGSKQEEESQITGEKAKIKEIKDKLAELTKPKESENVDASVANNSISENFKALMRKNGMLR